MINQEYNLAISETLDILDHIKKADVDKISERFLRFLKENASNRYISTIDFNKPLKEMNLNPKTIGMLSIINKKFWCNDQQRKEFERKLKDNELIYQNELREKYNPDNLFQKSNNNDYDFTKNQEMSLKKVEKLSILQRILNKIQKIFSKK